MVYKGMQEYEIEDRGNATISAAKTLEMIEFLDDEVLEEVYARAKAERRERNKQKAENDGITVTHIRHNWKTDEYRIEYKSGNVGMEVIYPNANALLEFLGSNSVIHMAPNAEIPTQ